jgi:uncharacterized protein YaiE (UPF0345 family)
MEIKHNTYFDEAVQSIGFVENGKLTMTVGLLLPGDYDFERAGPKETITILTGKVRINDNVYTENKTCVIESGAPIKVMALEPSSYICRYGD